MRILPSLLWPGSVSYPIPLLVLAPIGFALELVIFTGLICYAVRIARERQEGV